MSTVAQGSTAFCFPGPRGAGRLAAALAVLLLLVQGLPLAHALLERAYPQLGDLCVVAAPGPDGQRNSAHVALGCDTCCCAALRFILPPDVSGTPAASPAAQRAKSSPGVLAPPGANPPRRPPARAPPASS